MLEPHLEINHSATRLPSPVLITAREMNIAIPINQIVPLANPDNAATLSLLPGERRHAQNAETISAIIVTAPIGSTLRMMAKIVAAKWQTFAMRGGRVHQAAE